MNPIEQVESLLALIYIVRISAAITGVQVTWTYLIEQVQNVFPQIDHDLRSISAGVIKRCHIPWSFPQPLLNS